MILRRYHRHRLTKKQEAQPRESVDLEKLTVKELRDMAKDMDIDEYYNMRKTELIKALKG